jgi:hypothetical protein
MRERRRQRRIRQQLEVTWRNAQSAGTGVTWNISVDGAYIATPDAVAVKSIVDLEIHPGDGRAPLRCTGRVIWLNQGQVDMFPPGFGIEFQDGGTELMAHLAFLKENALGGKKKRP